MGRHYKVFSQKNVNAMEKHPVRAGIGFVIMGLFLFVLCIILRNVLFSEIFIFGIGFILVGIIFLIFGSVLLYSAYSQKKLHKQRLEILAKSNIYEIDNMNGRTFEEFLQVLYTKLGYKVRLTKTTGDYGADLIIEKDYHTIAIQAKHSVNKISISAVQEVIGARGHYQTTNAAVVTNNYFTKPALNLAESNDIELIDRTKLAELMCKVKDLEKDEPKIVDVA